MNILPAIISFVVGAAVSLLELITSKYPRTFFLLKKSTALYAYTLIYGILSFLVMLIVKSLIHAKIISLEGIGISNEWIQALVVGVTTKAILHIRLFNITFGRQSFPIGIETFVYLFEPWLLRTIDLDEFNGIRSYIAVYQKKYSDLTDIKNRIKDNIPQTLTGVERKAFITDLTEKDSAMEAMELYLQTFGKRSFERVFPL
ncbi:MAG: hypothetical protein ONB16_06510 [candidate division KSB1 bacterium]|nr:hypothetical protein [candidate division KSB1 bacterium]MDZ7319353.1 hypothetical protein [candidate division KSB1 bacterium]MDZ7340759.1 hypothetical protein [candidate division KSB1 bacterium]